MVIIVCVRVNNIYLEIVDILLFLFNPSGGFVLIKRSFL